MPNLVDLSLRQAEALIESSGLEIGLLRYKPDLSINVVLDQLYNGIKIQTGDSIQKGSVVDLLLGKGLSNQRSPVPSLIGLKLDPARNKILGSSLNLGTFVYDNTIKTGADTTNAFVYKQIPEFKVESTLQLGSAIYLWLTVDAAKLKVDTNRISQDTIPSTKISDKLPN